MENLVDDLSAFVISGRVKSHLHGSPAYETSERTPAQGVDDGVQAERLGFRRVFLAERPELKEPATILGGIGARTSRIGLGTGIIAAGSRHPMLIASFGATMQAAYGPRFTLGIGRGASRYSFGGSVSFAAFADLCTIVKRIWAGEQFEYDGPAGKLGRLGLQDWYEGPAPEIICGSFGLPRAAEVVATTSAIDGLIMPAMVTPAAVARVSGWLQAACERAGRDPRSVRLIVEVVTAPGLSEEETRQLTNARAVTYFQPPEWGHCYAVLNQWDETLMDELREHRQFAAIGGELADLSFHRAQLAEPARMIPDAWMAEACAIGTVEDCVRKLQEFRDAGADEVCTYGSTPAQNAGLIAAWRERTTVSIT
jgi:5,10-methylenetetrahydromethanopterin reductase